MIGLHDHTVAEHLFITRPKMSSVNQRKQPQQ